MSASNVFDMRHEMKSVSAMSPVSADEVNAFKLPDVLCLIGLRRSMAVAAFGCLCNRGYLMGLLGGDLSGF